jgi:serine/threonine-protein kinase
MAQSASEVPTTAVRVPRRFTLERPQFEADLAPLLRRRLMLIAVVIAATTMFFALYRAAQPAQWAFFRASTAGTGLLLLEVSLLVAALAAAALLWRRRRWSVGALRTIEFGLVAYISLYVAWSQLFAWNGARFAEIGMPMAPLDPFILRQVVDSMAVRWIALIVGVATLVPETARRNAALVGILAAVALALTAYLGTTEPVYRPHVGLMLLLMTFWMTLAATIAIFGAYKVAELRQQVSAAKELGQYRLIRRIGAGSMGEVHLAEHLLLRQPCAIKLIRSDRASDADALSRFEQEVRATSRLNHWNTVRIYDYGYTEEGTFYYVMEYLGGWTFEELVRMHGPVPAPRTIHLLRQVCAALREAHAIGLVHRDIKPANIITCTRGGVSDLVKLLDFGLVRHVGERGRDVMITSPGQIAGTPAYMSPEQVSGDGTLDDRSDIYSLGAVAYFLLTGQPPFVRDNSMRTLMAQVRDAPAPPHLLQPTVPADLEAVVLRCLAKDRFERFLDINALDAALAACEAAGRWTGADAERWWQSQPEPERDTITSEVEWT